eukprot:Hpha_TRINITY_DN19494_c0_g1::TRINITY_DN19494_c0_g1_i1::g.45739::m.45739
MEILEGTFQKIDAKHELDRSGGPRSWRRMQGFQEFVDADTMELAEWARDPGLPLPRVAVRKRRQGGAVVILRDVSYSMNGLRALWAQSVSEEVVNIADRRGMRVGYVEFSDTPRRWMGGADGQLLSRDYEGLKGAVRRSRQEGLTNYQRALGACLTEFVQIPSPQKHILFLTDGEPTTGCRNLHLERSFARRWGVSVHTVYISNECASVPEVLRLISRETGGFGFRAIHESNTLRVSAT